MLFGNLKKIGIKNLFQTGKFYAAKYLRSTKENEENVEESEEALRILKQNAKVRKPSNRSVQNGVYPPTCQAKGLQPMIHPTKIFKGKNISP